MTKCEGTTAGLSVADVCAWAEGKERPVEDYARLLTAAGFTAIEGRRTGTALDAVLATKS